MNVLKPTPTFEELVRQASGRQIPRVKQRKALALSQDPRIQQIVGALTDTSQAYEKALAETRATSAALTAAASHAGVSKAALAAVTPAPPPKPATPPLDPQELPPLEDIEDAEMIPAGADGMFMTTEPPGFMMKESPGFMSSVVSAAVSAAVTGLLGRPASSSAPSVLGAVGPSQPSLPPTEASAQRLPKGSMADLVTKNQLRQTERRMGVIMQKKFEELKQQQKKLATKVTLGKFGRQVTRQLNDKSRDQEAAIKEVLDQGLEDLAEAHQEYITDSAIHVKGVMREVGEDIKESMRRAEVTTSTKLEDYGNILRELAQSKRQADIPTGATLRDYNKELRDSIRADMSSEMTSVFQRLYQLLQEDRVANGKRVADEIRLIASSLEQSQSKGVGIIINSLERGLDMSQGLQARIVDTLNEYTRAANNPMLQEMYIHLGQLMGSTDQQMRGMAEIMASVRRTQMEIAAYARGAQEIQQQQQQLAIEQQRILAIENERRLAIENGQPALGNGQLAIENGQLALSNGQLAILAQRQTTTVERALVLREGLDGARQAGESGSLLAPLSQPSSFVPGSQPSRFAASLGPHSQRDDDSQGPFSLSLAEWSQRGNAALGSASSSGV